MPTPLGSSASTPTADSIALRQRVLDSAAALFARKSYAGTTMEEVADSVGELRGTVYYHFDNKQALLEGIQLRLTEELASRLEEAQRSQGTPAERLGRMVAALTDAAIDHPDAFATSLEDLKYLTPRARRDAAQRVDDVLGMLAEAIDAALPDARRADVDSAVTASTIFYTIANVHNWYRPTGRLPREEVTRQVTRLLLGGIADA